MTLAFSDSEFCLNLYFPNSRKRTIKYRVFMNGNEAGLKDNPTEYLLCKLFAAMSSSVPNDLQAT